MFRSVSSFASVFVFFALINLTGCSTRVAVKVGDIPAPSTANPTTKQQAEAFINGVKTEKNFKEVTDSKQLQRVNRIFRKLELAAGYPSNTFPVHVLDAKEEVNAMAVGGASIVVYKKLIDRVKDDNELAVVLSHEMGHVLGKHADDEGKKDRESIISIGSSILGAITAGALSAAGYGGVADVAGDVAQKTTGLIGYGALVGSFDRDQEYEADHIGMMLLGKAGFDPRAALTFWSEAEDVFGHSHNQVSAFFGTHPSFGDRKDALEEALPFAMKYFEESKAKTVNNSKSQKAKSSKAKADKK